MADVQKKRELNRIKLEDAELDRALQGALAASLGEESSLGALDQAVLALLGVEHREARAEAGRALAKAGALDSWALAGAALAKPGSGALEDLASFLPMDFKDWRWAALAAGLGNAPALAWLADRGVPLESPEGLPALAQACLKGLDKWSARWSEGHAMALGDLGSPKRIAELSSAGKIKALDALGVHVEASAREGSGLYAEEPVAALAHLWDAMSERERSAARSGASAVFKIALDKPAESPRQGKEGPEPIVWRGWHVKMGTKNDWSIQTDADPSDRLESKKQKSRESLAEWASSRDWPEQERACQEAGWTLARVGMSGIKWSGVKSRYSTHGAWNVMAQEVFDRIESLLGKPIWEARGILGAYGDDGCHERGETGYWILSAPNSPGNALRSRITRGWARLPIEDAQSVLLAFSKLSRLAMASPEMEPLARFESEMVALYDMSEWSVDFQSTVNALANQWGELKKRRPWKSDPAAMEAWADKLELAAQAKYGDSPLMKKPALRV